MVIGQWSKSNIRVSSAQNIDVCWWKYKIN